MFNMIKNKVKSFYNNLLIYFVGDNKLTTVKISKYDYSYSNLKDNNITVITIDEDIVKAISTMKTILVHDFDSPVSIDGVPKIKESSFLEYRLMFWVSEDGDMLADANHAVQEFNNISSELIDKYEMLVKFRSKDVRYKYNIRILKPYITNIVDIRSVLLIACKE